jgi:dTDP-4-amino-4,6-dideoxygalactose transaminase
MQARLALRQLRDVHRHTVHRRALAAIYRERFAGMNAVRMLSDDRTTTSIYLAFPLLVDERVEFVRHLMRMGHDIAIQHINNAADLRCFAEFATECPIARKVSRSLVLLPTYPGYSEEEARRTADSIRQFVLSH